MLIIYFLILTYRWLVLDIFTPKLHTVLDNYASKQDLHVEFKIDDFKVFPPKLVLKELNVNYKRCQFSAQNVFAKISFKDLLNTKLTLSRIGASTVNLKINKSCLNTKLEKKSIIKVKRIKLTKLKVQYAGKKYSIQSLYYSNLSRIFLGFIAKNIFDSNDYVSIALFKEYNKYKIKTLNYEGDIFSTMFSATLDKKIKSNGYLKIKKVEKFKRLLGKYVNYAKIPELYTKNINLKFTLAMSKSFKLERLNTVFSLNQIKYKKFTVDRLAGHLVLLKDKFTIKNLTVIKNHNSFNKINIKGDLVKKNLELDFKRVSIKDIAGALGADFPYLSADISGKVLVKELGKEYKLDYKLYSKQLDIYAYFVKERLKSKIMFVKDIAINGNGVLNDSYLFSGIANTKGGSFQYKITDEHGNVKVTYKAKDFFVNQNISTVSVKSRLSFDGYTLANSHYVHSETKFKTKYFKLFDMLRIDNSRFTMLIEDYVLSFKNGVTPLASGNSVKSDIVLDFSGDEGIFKTKITTDAVMLDEIFKATSFKYNDLSGVYKGRLDIYGLMSDSFTYHAKGKVFNTRVPKLLLNLGDLNVDTSFKGGILNGKISSNHININAVKSHVSVNIDKLPYDFPHISGQLSADGSVILHYLDFVAGKVNIKLYTDTLGYFSGEFTGQHAKWHAKLDYDDKLYNSELSILGYYDKKWSFKLKYKNLYTEFIKSLTGINLYSDLKASGKLEFTDLEHYKWESNDIKIFVGSRNFKVEPFKLIKRKKVFSISDISLKSDNCTLKITQDKHTYKVFGCLDSVFLNSFIQTNIVGYLNLDLAYNKQINGKIDLKNIFINYQNTLLEFNGVLPVKNNRIYCKTLSANLNNQTVNFAGYLQLLPNFVPNLELKFTDVPLWYDKLSGKLDGRLHFGRKKRYTVRGNLVVRDGVYTLQGFDSDSLGDSYDFLVFKLGIDLQNLTVDTTDIHLLMDGKIDINGNLKDYKGTVNLKDGKITYMDNDFKLKYGRVFFKHKLYDYNVTFDTLLDKYNVEISAKGKNTDKINMNLRSTPALTEQQIMSLLMTGDPFVEPDTPVSHLKLARELKKQIGVDIGINYKGLNNNMSVDLKKDIGKNLRLKYNRDIANKGEQKVNLEYRINKNVDIDVSVQGDTSFDKVNNSVGIKFRHEF